MMNRNQIILSMCHTYRSDYETIITDDDRMYTLNSGVTSAEQTAIWKTMAEIFDNNIAPHMEFKDAQ